MKLVIAGTRTFSNYELLKEYVIKNYSLSNLEIVSGTASGADSLGERFANEFGLPLYRFPANWSKYGKRAGILRNKEMTKFCDQCLVFWDGKSRGSYNMIQEATIQNKKVKFIIYENSNFK